MEPTTLLEAVEYFKVPANCREYLVARRWPNGVECPHCGSKNVSYSEKHNRWQCASHHAPKEVGGKGAPRQFTLKTGTIMEDSPIGLDKWLPAIWLICSNRNGISSWELHRALGVTQKTAWFMLQRIRLAMQDDFSGGMLGGEVEIDESFIGGKARNMHKDRKLKTQAQGRNTGNKTIVMGLLERANDGRQKRVRTSILSDRKASSMQPEIAAHVEKGALVYSDEFGANWRMDGYYHFMVNHLESYVNNNVHTNGIENFWSLLKRTIGGTYVSVEPYHLYRYVDEQAFRFNNRLREDGEKITDAERFSQLCKQIVGRRLTYAELTAKERPEAKAF